jgi:hypothetical protein
MGAVAAGAPSFSTKIQMPGRISVPVAKPATAVAEKIDETARAEAEQTFGWIYVTKRVAAYVVDTTFNIVMTVATFSFVLWQQNINPDALFTPGVVLISALFLIFFNWCLITAQEVAFGTSFGKRIFGLGLVGNLSAIFMRAFFFLPSIGFAGLGLIWALFDRRKRCWHDVAADLQPIEIARL